MTTPAAAARSSRPGKRRKRWPWVVTSLLLLGGVGGGVYYNRTRTTQTVTETQTVTTQAVRPGTVRISVSGPGTLEANATRTVGADLTATVGQVPAVGERVTKGQLLTTLNSDEVEENVQTAELNLRKAQASLDATRAGQSSSRAGRQSSVTQAQGNVADARQALTEAERTLNAQEQLYAIGAVSGQALNDARNTANKARLTLQSAQASLTAAQTQAETGSSSDAENLRSAQIAVQQAQAALETAQKARTDLKVYAPIGGVVSAVNATEGTVVLSGATLLTIIDDATLNLPVQVDETEIAGVQVGQAAEVTLDAYDGETFEGEVIRVSPGATQSNGISVFTATVSLSNEEGKLRSGMTAEAEIIQSEARGLLVPTGAIETVRSRSYVQVPGEGEGAEPERVRVQTGPSDGTNTVVIEGLEAGQEVMVPGSARNGTSGASGASSTRPSSGFGGVGRRVPGGFGGAP
ncbi:efflux RND transporter periplasmic adaptor subunit [Deinococcus hopiensis]|uniref:HlyD family secretion protein n=1 Tax=Deinococcus hopiensis KR-140 TaxID=695939 RepID=A0A1W1U9V6_9DEIO|nr:efflux RND transporter periplasmic adaptor subunit [Deinococcus hopiensis]SMB77847.1 HlyD family secretion protein [Deinococcus hopiensis KR-140]